MTSWRLVVLALVASVVPASANVGRRQQGGEPTGEPMGIGEVAITHEELVIDMRPIADSGRASISATYHLDNRGADKQLDLVFAAGSPSSAFVITLDGKDVRTTTGFGTTLPASWRPPTETPRFDGGTLDYELNERTVPISFQIAVTPGRHDLAVSYSADVVRYHAGEPTVLYQLAYVLSPARTWAGFGGLDVTVRVPPDWRVASAPVLTRAGDTLHATFATVPADALALTVSAPLGAHAIVKIAVLVLFLLVAFGGLFVVVWRTRVHERRCFEAKKVSSGTLTGFGRGFVWAAAFFASGLLAIMGPDLALPSGQADHHGYGQAFAVIGVVVGAFVVLVVGTIVSVIVGRRVHARAQAPE